MLQRLVTPLLVLFVASSAFAQTSPCSGGTTNPLFTLIPGNPAQLRFEHATVHLFEGAPLVTVSGYNVTVIQQRYDVPGLPLTAGASALNCNAQTVSPGVLGPGA